MNRHTRHIRIILFLSLLLSSFVFASATSDQVVVTSGRVFYDAFGRVTKTYHPTVDGDTVTVYSDTVDTEPPTVTEYDILDRPVKVTYPDSTFTETAYGVAGHVQVVTVTDAMGNVSKTHVDGSGRTVKSIRFESPVSQDSIVTEFTYDGIGRLVEVTDADSNVTVSEYDMGDRRVRVVHPASGETTFTYDALGNVLTKQTANLRDSAQFIVYGYDRGRLVSVSYPGHPENDVRYYYGGVNDQGHAKGRLCFRRDATGGEQYAYDNLGNVKETLRTVTVPNEAVVTFRTIFEYDSYGKLLSLTYPDEEMVCYWYDGSGQLTEIYTGDRADCHHYVHEIGYDKFGDRVYMRYGNGTETSYRYDNMRRLDTLSVSKPGQFSLFRIYEYDDVGNIIKLTNTNTGSPLLYPPVIHRYEYDGLYRLTAAHGNETDPQTGYELSMSYYDMYRITCKTQTIRQTGIQFPGTLNAGYDLAYTYDRTPGRRFRMSSVSDVNYRTVGSPADGDSIAEDHFYEYDPNGNILRVNTSRVRADGGARELTREEKFRWDDENRLTAISQDGYVSNYWYDADGERVIKEHGGNQAVFVNGSQDSVLTDTRQFTVYPSAYLVVHNGGWYTKHIYIGTERVSSRMGSVQGKLKESFEANVVAGRNVLPSISYGGQCDTMALVMKSNYEHFGLPYNGKNRRANSMVSTEPWDGGDGGLLPDGPRYYCMPGNADETVTGGEGGPSGAPRRAKKVDGDGKFYYYHSDHLGSSSMITDSVGNVTQQMEYLPYGEVFLEKRSTDQNVNYFTPYKFNGKELDEETGLYYYGARYMNPRLSIWYATDPLEEKYPQLSSYCYTACNPIVLLDTDGKDIIIAGKNKSSVTFITKKINVSVDASSIGVDWGGCYTLQGRAVLGAALDIVGVFDPTGLADGFNAKLQFDDGEWGGALISAFGLIPYVGDVAKVGKINKDIKVIEAAIDAFKESKNAAKAVNGNSKTSSKAQHVYEIFDTETGKTVKTGISGGRVSKNGKSYRATSQVNKWNKTAGRQVYDSKIVEEIPAGKNARAKALDSEKKNANKLRQQGQLDPKFHKRP